MHIIWKAGYNQSQIAKEIGVHKSTISRELKRNITFVVTLVERISKKTLIGQVGRKKAHFIEVFDTLRKQGNYGQ